jgi:hypothetical protein
VASSSADAEAAARRAQVVIIVLIAGAVLLAAALVCLLSSLVPAQTNAAPPPGLSRDERWREDLRQLAGEWPRSHKNLFFRLKKEEFERMISDLDRAIPSLRDHEIVVRMVRLGAAVGDAHSGVGWNFPRRFPLGLTWFKDGLYVTRTTPEYKRHLGSRLLKIGETDTGKVYEALRSVIPHENEPWLLIQSPRYMTTPEFLNALKFLPSLDRGTFVLEDAKGKRTKLELAPITPDAKTVWVYAVDANAPDAPLYRRRGDLNYWFEYLPDARTLYVKYNKCAEMESLPFAKFNEQVWDAVARNAVERFVIDLRQNDGGNSAVLRPMLEALARRDELNRRGRLFALIGRGTFSSGFLNALEMRKYTKALLVGEPTGQKPNAYGELQNFTLKNSGLKVFYSTKFFKLSDEDTPSLMPDLTVEMSAADYFAGRDPVLAAAISYKEK